MKDLDTETYKTLMEKNPEDKNKWKDSPCSWIGKIKIVKMSILPNIIHDPMQYLLKFQWNFLWK